MKKCPKCGCEKFYVTAHVVDEWLVDANGYYIETTASATEVAHYPDNEDMWVCVECGYDDAGKEFEIEEEM